MNTPTIEPPPSIDLQKLKQQLTTHIDRLQQLGFTTKLNTKTNDNDQITQITQITICPNPNAPPNRQLQICFYSYNNNQQHTLSCLSNQIDGYIKGLYAQQYLSIEFINTENDQIKVNEQYLDQITNQITIEIPIIIETPKPIRKLDLSDIQ